jgi:multidrug efflux system membrane fusion protein
METNKNMLLNKLCNFHLKKRLVDFSTVTLLLFAVVLILSLQSSNAMEMPPTQVSVVLAKERLLAPTMQVSGSVISLNDANISTQVTGELQWLAAVGSKVKQGDIIAKIVPTLLEIDLQSAEAQLEKLRADLDYREQEVKRFKVLAKQNNTSKTRLQEESAKRDMLIQDIQGGKANLAMAKHNLSQTNIRAPFSGHIMSQLASTGEFLSIGDHVVRFVDTFNREIALNAPMALLPYLKMELPIQVSASKSSGTLPISAIVPVGDKTSRMIEIRLAMTNNQWIVGTPVTVSLPKAAALTRITIPRDALIIKGSAVFIYRVDQNMLAERIEAEIEVLDGSWVAIKAQLNVGDKIVIRGGERLMPKQSVSILD